jgi:hypothetical protein
MREKKRNIIECCNRKLDNLKSFQNIENNKQISKNELCCNISINEYCIKLLNQSRMPSGSKNKK